jgi:hypothetical protein
MIVHIHVPKEKRMKLEPSGKKGTFAGYRVSHMEIDCEEWEDHPGLPSFFSAPISRVLSFSCLFVFRL